jgi:transcriptional regulator with XRE-family HTH domain
MNTTKWKDLKHKSSAEKRQIVRSEVRAEILEADLRSMRELVGKTQVEMAEALERNQSQVSEIENRGDHRLSTLRRYVQALGGELDVVVRFGDKSLRLKSAP